MYELYFFIEFIFGFKNIRYWFIGLIEAKVYLKEQESDVKELVLQKIQKLFC